MREGHGERGISGTMVPSQASFRVTSGTEEKLTRDPTICQVSAFKVFGVASSDETVRRPASRSVEDQKVITFERIVSYIPIDGVQISVVSLRVEGFILGSARQARHLSGLSCSVIKGEDPVSGTPTLPEQGLPVLTKRPTLGATCLPGRRSLGHVSPIPRRVEGFRLELLATVFS